MTGNDLTMRSTRTFEPPYDDEAVPTELTQGSLALALTIGSPSEPPSLRLLPGGKSKPARKRPSRSSTVTPVPDEPDAKEDEGPLLRAVVRTPRSELPPPKAFGARLVQHLTEATSGERPLAHLAPYLSRTVYQRLERHFEATVRGSSAVDDRANVRSVHVCEPADGVAELAAVVRRGGRMAAIALRLEGLDGRWQCTALQMT